MRRGTAESENAARLGGSAMASRMVRRKRDGERNKRTGLLTVTRVVLEGVESDRVAMKFPSAKFASVAGRSSWRDTSYG
jgi:hypothetical protein